MAVGVRLARLHAAEVPGVIDLGHHTVAQQVVDLLGQSAIHAPMFPAAPRARTERGW